MEELPSLRTSFGVHFVRKYSEELVPQNLIWVKMKPLRYFSALLLFATCALSAQSSAEVSANNDINAVQESRLANDPAITESLNFAPNFFISPIQRDGQLKVMGLANNWENVILRSLDGETYLLIPNDTAKPLSEISLDFSKAPSGMYFCEVEYRDQRKSVKSFRLP